MSYPELLAEAKKNTAVVYENGKYKHFYNVNPEYINDMYQIINIHYSLRDKYKFKVYHFKTKTWF